MKSAERFVGGYSMEVPPLTIPNREVKLHSADGTIIDGRVGRCQLNITQSSIAIAIGLLCFSIESDKVTQHNRIYIFYIEKRYLLFFFHALYY